MRIMYNMTYFEELIRSIDSVEKLDLDDIETISKLMLHKNDFMIEDISQISQIDEIRKQKCDELINSDKIDDKKRAILLSKFGYTLETAELLLKRYGTDIDEIENEDLKIHIKCLESILNLNDGDKELLECIYYSCDGVEFENPLAIERELKSEYGKLYNQGLLRIEECEQIEPNVYEAGTDFKIVLTSLSPWSGCLKIDNHYKYWNMPSIASQHMCTSYIRNDMIGTISIAHFCYGFTDMKNDSLMLSSNQDICSSERCFVSVTNDDQKFLSPDNMINSTNGYNELDYRRIQNGVKKSPDYIVVFRKNGIIVNMEDAKRASAEFKEDPRYPDGLPIVVVDTDKCLEMERIKLESMLEEFKKNPSIELAHAINTKIRNNAVTMKRNSPFRGYHARLVGTTVNRNEKPFFDCNGTRIEGDFAMGLDLSKVNDMLSREENSKKVSLKELAENDQMITSQERGKAYVFLRKIINIIQNRDTRNEVTEIE